MADKPTISFDAQGRVRVLDAEQFRKTEELESECRTFVSSGSCASSSSCCCVFGAVAEKHFRLLAPSTEIREFSENVRVLVQLLSSQAEVIEAEKLKVRAVAQAMDRPKQR